MSPLALYVFQGVLLSANLALLVGSVLQIAIEYKLARDKQEFARFLDHSRSVSNASHGSKASSRKPRESHAPRPLPPPSVGRVQYIFHRTVFACSLIQTVMFVDPFTYYGFYPAPVIFFANAIDTCIIFDSAVALVFFILKIASDSRRIQVSPVLRASLICIGAVTTLALLAFEVVNAVEGVASWVFSLEDLLMAAMELVLFAVFIVSLVLLLRRIRDVDHALHVDPTRSPSNRDRELSAPSSAGTLGSQSNLIASVPSPTANAESVPLPAANAPYSPEQMQVKMPQRPPRASAEDSLRSLKIFAVLVTFLACTLVPFQIYSGLSELLAPYSASSIPSDSTAELRFMVLDVVQLLFAMGFFWFAYLPLSFLKPMRLPSAEPPTELPLSTVTSV